MSFVEKVNHGESLISWLNWLTESPAVCWSVIMGDLSPGLKGVYCIHPKAFRTGPPSCPVQGMHKFSRRVKFSGQLLFKTSFPESWLTYKGLKVDLKILQNTPFPAP